MAQVITVSALNRYVKTLLDANERLFDLALRGEIANFVQNARSGHCYFTLRDEDCSVKAVMFRSDARRLGFKPQDGMRVVVRCRVTLYERDGAFQVYVNDLFPDGIGSAQLALEQLKQKLYAEGLFAPEHKKALPAYPQAVGIVTSRTGAALQDIINVAGRRWPAVRLLLHPVNVQGFEAAQQIAQAITALDRSGKADVIIVARGGGSREDLWVFNAEVIARAAYRCKTPLISAIGHEIDFTILDLVADKRAPTPSAAAELAVPDRAEIQRHIAYLQQNMHIQLQKRCRICYNELASRAAGVQSCAALRYLPQSQRQLAQLARQLTAAGAQGAARSGQRLRANALAASALDPYQVLARGYAMLSGPGGICTVAQLRPGQQLLVRGSTHAAHCQVLTVEELDENAQKL